MFYEHKITFRYVIIICHLSVSINCFAPKYALSLFIQSSCFPQFQLSGRMFMRVPQAHGLWIRVFKSDPVIEKARIQNDP